MAHRHTATVTVSLALTYDAWKDMESALLDRQIKAADHPAMRDRLAAIRKDIERQVNEQKPRW